MIEAGEKAKLKILRIVPHGAYLGEEDPSGEGASEVLLPKKQIPEGAKTGDSIEVFIYRDSKGRLISTTAEPFITIGHTARLKVKEVTNIGAFLDMGLERDLLLPFAEQTYRPETGSCVLVSMYRDKSGRLAATMKVYDHLRKDPPYIIGDEVEGLVYEISRNFGAFVAVDFKYSALIPGREFAGEVKAGDIIKARVTLVKEDGKMDLSIRKKAYLQIDDDGETIMKYLSAHGGRIPFSDKADPEVIKENLHMSKAAFKRAAGHLMKNGKIKIIEDAIIVNN